MKRLITRVGAGATLAATQAQVAFAKVTRPDIDNPVSGGSLGSILASVINALLLFAGAVAVLFLIIGGFRYVVSTGNEQQVDAARKTILYAVLGLIIIFIAFVLTRLIQDYLGFTGDFQVR
ncbi:MAG: pilin [bacterium]|nr:pilin [bacterium]